jgi:hypothetical protein
MLSLLPVPPSLSDRRDQHFSSDHFACERNKRARPRKIALFWEQDFDWSGGAAAAGHEWTQDDWEENVGAAAAADNLYNYMEERNAAAAANKNHNHGDAYRWNGGDWNDEDWENQDLPLVHPVDRGDRDRWPLSIHSSLRLLESVPPTPSPSPPPLQLQYIPHGDAGPTYAIQVGHSLRLQPVEHKPISKQFPFLCTTLDNENINKCNSSRAVCDAPASAAK